MQKLKLITIFLRIIFVCILSGNGFSQTPLFKNYSVKDGLPSSETYRVHQDSKGYIWVVGDMGVSRFDGYRFQNYTTKDGLPENTILGLYEDYKHRIWFWSLSGQLAYFENEKIHPLTKVNKEMISKFQGGIINSIALDKNDTLHIGSFHIRGLFKVFFDGQNQSLIADTITNNGIYIQEIDNYKNEAVLTLNANMHFYMNVNYKLLEYLFLIDKEGNKQHIKRKWENFDYSNPNQKCIRLNSKKILISLDNEVWEIDHHQKLIKKISFENSVIYLKEGKNGNIWVGLYDNGVFLIQNGDYTKKPIHYLEGKSVSAVCEDQEGSVWFSTLENGIYYLSNRSFLHYNSSCGLMGEKINTLDVDAMGIIWVGFENGIYTSIKKNNIKNYFLPYSDQVSTVKYINASKKGEIVIGGSGVYLLKEKNSLVPITEKNNVFMSNSFVRTRYDGKLWSGGYGGIYEIKEEKGFYHGCTFRINTMCEEEKGILLLGAINGLWHFKNKQFIYLGNQHPLLKLRINDLKYNNKTIWIGTKEDGLIIKKGNRVYQIRENQGLISDFCKSVFVDKDGIVWVGTNKGLSRISFKKKGIFTQYQIYNYTTINGLISNEINQVVVKGNKVYVATNKGVSIFDKNNVSVNQTTPPIYITRLSINHRLFPVKNNYSLPYYQNTLKISFVGLSYKNTRHVEYKYRLQGLDTNWHYTKYKYIDFTTLPYGDYTFEVCAKNNDGFWSSKPAITHFSIAPPFWHTWWFRVLTASALISGIFFFIRYRVRLIVKRAEEKTALYKKAAEMEKEKSALFQKASEMEMKFLSAQMNPHFTFNAMNSIQHFMLDHEPEKAQHYLAKYAKLIRRVLENNMEKFVPLDDELDMLEIYMEIESMRFSTPFEFEINVCEELEEKEYQIPPMILQPYVENAIWHGIFYKKEGIGKLTLSFSLEENNIKCIIEDNGVGRKKAKEFNSKKKDHRSVGMLITQERLQHLQSDSDIDVRTKISDIVNENGEVCGTRVEVCLPLNSHPSVQK